MASLIVNGAGGVGIGGGLTNGHSPPHGVVGPAVGVDADIGGGLVLVGDLGPLHIADGDVVGLADHDHGVPAADQLVTEQKGYRQVQLILGLSRVDTRSPPRDLGLHDLGVGAVGLQRRRAGHTGPLPQQQDQAPALEVHTR